MSRHSSGFLNGLLSIVGLIMLVIGFFGLIFFPRPGVTILVGGILLSIWCAGTEQNRQNQPPQKEQYR